MFKDRIEAGLFLAAKLKKYKNDPSVILAVPRGGVPVAYTVAKELNFPMEILLTKKIVHPLNKEYAIGAASLTDYFVVPHKDVTEEYIQSELKRIRIRLEEMKQKFMGDKESENLMGKTVIIVDDGMATGNTILNTVNVIRKNKPKKIVIAVPVASPDAIKKLSMEVDEVVTVFAPTTFYGVGAFYDHFIEVNDDEVLFYLDKMHRLSATN